MFVCFFCSTIINNNLIIRHCFLQYSCPWWRCVHVRLVCRHLMRGMYGTMYGQPCRCSTTRRPTPCRLPVLPSLAIVGHHVIHTACVCTHVVLDLAQGRLVTPVCCRLIHVTMWHGEQTKRRTLINQKKFSRLCESYDKKNNEYYHTINMSHTSIKFKSMPSRLFVPVYGGKGVHCICE